MAKSGVPAAIMMMMLLWLEAVAVGASWCVARSDASDEALQTALDYACFAGADCVPLQPNGLCYLPNTLLAHASYAFNSYSQRKSMAPGSCDFSGTATVAKTDPSYGSCVYPASPSSAGGATTTPTTNPMTGAGGYNPSTTPMNPMSTTPLGGDGSGGLNNPSSEPLTSSDNSLWECRGNLASLMVHMLVALSFASQLIWMV